MALYAAAGELVVGEGVSRLSAARCGGLGGMRGLGAKRVGLVAPVENRGRDPRRQVERRVMTHLESRFRGVRMLFLRAGVAAFAAGLAAGLACCARIVNCLVLIVSSSTALVAARCASG